MLYFKLARDSLKFLIKEYEIKELYIPYYLCDVIRHSLFEVGCKPLFYHIDDNFMPATDFPKNSYILYPNYFGVCENNVDILANIYPKLIVDNAHAFYSKPRGFACFNSEPKFRPVKEGSYLWIKKMGIPQKTEYPEKKLRNEIFNDMHKRYMKMNLIKFDLATIESPFCYPCLLSTNKEADNLARELQNQGCTIFRYWNNLPKSFNEYKFYRRLVPIPLYKYSE